jgi:hypothetical protein
MAFYRFGLEWETFLKKIDTDFLGVFNSVVE